MNARKYLWWRMCHQGGGPRYETFKRMLVQTLPCQAAPLDLRNGHATVLALRQMQSENALGPMIVMDAAALNSHGWMRLRLLARHVAETY
jgi:hypothetical protein